MSMLGIYDASDDVFEFEVQVQLSDHYLNANGSLNEFHVSVKFGDTIVVRKLRPWIFCFFEYLAANCFTFTACLSF